VAKLHHYPSSAIEVSYDAKRCIHAAECVMRLRAVFDTAKKPWVQPDQAGSAEVAAVIEQCPSGALHYERKDGGAGEQPATVNSVTVQRDGPLYVRGDVEIVAADGSVVLKETRVALCRCGRSQNKPYCDNSHCDHFHNAGESGKDLGPQAVTVEHGVLKILPNPNGSLKLSGPCEIHTTDGKVVRVERVALCRCGESKVQPYCDGTHKETGFQTE
jgi:CDGSH-type Zn-finger protein/uncharacterized Fe-S cluster protein YjdI